MNRLACTTCGAAFEAPQGRDATGTILEESARCARLREINEQRKALEVARTQAGFAGMTASSETMDRVAHQTSMARLDLALKAEAEKISGALLHAPTHLQA